MMKSLFGGTALALALVAAPASAQLLGGSGGLGGALGGGLGGITGAGSGSLGGSLDGMIERAPVRTDDIARARGSASGSKHLDTRKGHASASGSAAGDGALDTSSVIGGATLGGGASGSAGGSGNADAQLIGTDAVRGATGQASGIARNGVGAARDTASGATSRVGSAAATGYRATGSAGGNASGAASGGLGQLALAGSSAANGAGSFGVVPGMDVTDSRGRLIGTVQSLRTTARGTVQQVVMKVGKRTATLPASNFTASGDGLVSAMSKGAVKDVASSGAGGSASGSGAAAGNGLASGNLGQLALAGSSAASGAGSFGVVPGMDVTDARGRLIGTVQSLRTTARGTVQQVVMKVGKRTATLPASNFTASGNVLVSAMGKGDVKSAAKGSGQ